MINKIPSLSTLDIPSQSVFQRAHAYRISTISESEFNKLNYEKQEQYLKNLRSEIFEINYSQNRLDSASMQADFAITSFVISLESAIFHNAIQPSDSELVSYILNRAIHCCNFEILEDRIENMLEEIYEDITNDFQKRHLINKYMQAGIKCAEFQETLAVLPDSRDSLIAAIFEEDPKDLPTQPEVDSAKPSIIAQIRSQLVALLPEKN